MLSYKGAEKRNIIDISTLMHSKNIEDMINDLMVRLFLTAINLATNDA